MHAMQAQKIMKSEKSYQRTYSFPIALGDSIP